MGCERRFGAMYREIREHLGVTQSQASERSGRRPDGRPFLPQTTISGVETGAMKEPRWGSEGPWASSLGLDGDLFLLVYQAYRNGEPAAQALTRLALAAA